MKVIEIQILGSSRDGMDSDDPNAPCKLGSHFITLEKINGEEEKLYKEIKLMSSARRLVFTAYFLRFEEIQNK
ncbi:hypothetical protein C5167_029703, partial [Papaver somniferum]